MGQQISTVLLNHGQLYYNANRLTFGPDLSHGIQNQTKWRRKDGLLDWRVISQHQSGDNTLLFVQRDYIWNPGREHHEDGAYNNSLFTHFSFINIVHNELNALTKPGQKVGQEIWAGLYGGKKSVCSGAIILGPTVSTVDIAVIVVQGDRLWHFGHGQIPEWSIIANRLQGRYPEDLLTLKRHLEHQHPVNLTDTAVQKTLSQLVIT